MPSIRTGLAAPGVSRFQAQRRMSAGVPLTVTSGAAESASSAPGPPSTVRWLGAVFTSHDELGAGVPVSAIPDDLALDGIDELLKVFVAYSVIAWGEYFTEALAGSPGRTLKIQTMADAGSPGAAWVVNTSPSSLTVEGGPDEKPAEDTVADVVISGTPADVLRWSWNRETPGEPSRVAVEGSPDTLAEFQRCVVIATQ